MGSTWSIALTTSNASEPPKLHVELYEHIFAHLDAIEDFQTLLNLSLTCATLSKYGQAVLFSKVVLGRPTVNPPLSTVKTTVRSNTAPPRMFRPATLFRALLGASPHLAKYVKELVISDRRYLPFYQKEKSWLRGDEQIALILPLLPNLCKISIYGYPSHIDHRFTWDLLRPSLQRAIVDELRIGTISSLDAHRLDIPVAILGLSPSLKYLSLRGTLFRTALDASHHDEGLPASLCKPSLSSLEIATFEEVEWSQFEQWLTGPSSPNLSSLRTLVISFSPRSIAKQLAFVKKHLHSLDCLELQFPKEVYATTDFPNVDIQFVDLAAAPRLKQFKITVLELSCREINMNPSNKRESAFEWLLALTTIVANAALSTLVIDLHFGLEMGLLSTLTQWAGVEQLMQRLTAMEGIDVRLCLSGPLAYNFRKPLPLSLHHFVSVMPYETIQKRYENEGHRTRPQSRTNVLLTTG